MEETERLESERLYLRPLETGDREAIFRLINHDRDVLRYYVAEYLENEEELPIERMIASFEKTGKHIFAIVLKENDEVIGNIFQCSGPDRFMNSSEVGYAIGKEYWNQGYMSEALKLMIAFLFGKGIHKVSACHIEENKASGRVMEKCGMTYEGKRIDELYYHGKYHDTLHYFIINKEE